MRWADRVSTSRGLQAESPRWIGGNELCWVDMGSATFVVGALVHGRLEVTRSERVGTRIGMAARIRDSDDWIVAADRALHRLRPDGSRSLVADLPGGTGFACDGICDPSGRLWVGTQTIDRAPLAALYSVDQDGLVTERLGGVTVSNGICFSADGRRMYYIDTLPHRAIETFRVGDDGSLRDRLLVTVVDGGNPDGMAIDADGALWVAVWHAGEARRYAPDGRLLEVVRVPARRTSAVALVGSTLVITTAMTPGAGEDDLGGHLFAVDAPSPGLPSPPFLLSRP